MLRWTVARNPSINILAWCVPKGFRIQMFLRAHLAYSTYEHGSSQADAARTRADQINCNARRWSCCLLRWPA